MDVFSLSCGRNWLFDAGSIEILLTAISIITGYQYWLTHIGVFSMQCVLSREIVDVTFPSRLEKHLEVVYLFWLEKDQFLVSPTYQ